MKKKIVGIFIMMLLILSSFAGITSALSINKDILEKEKNDIFYAKIKSKTTESFDFYCDANGPYSGYVGEESQFTGSASGGEPPYFFLWAFGDGYFSEEQNPTHVYEETGEYPVILMVDDYSGQQSVDETWAYISEEPEDDVPPQITIDYPLDGGNYYGDPEITVHGYFTDNVGVIYLGAEHTWDDGYETGEYIPDEPCKYCNFVWDIRLRPGENTIQVFVVDVANNIGEDEVTVYFTDEPPTVEDLASECDETIKMLESYRSELNNILQKIIDSDSDGYPDDVDVDRDGDGTPDDQDSDPDDPKKDRDTDGDGKDDAVDDDDDGDGIPDSQDDDDDGDGNSDDDEKILNDNLQKLKSMRDPAVDAAISAAESINPGGDLFDSSSLPQGTLGTTSYSGNKPNIQGSIEIDLSQHRKPDGSIDEDEKLDTMLHEMRHCYQTWLIQQNEVTLGTDLDGDGTLENGETNDEDDDWLPRHVPAGMDLEGDLQDDDDTKETPWDPDNDGDWVNDNDAYARRDRDARDFASKKLKDFKDSNWNWWLRWLNDLISELNSAISKLDNIIQELENIIQKLDYLGMDDDKEAIEDGKEALENDKSDLEGAVNDLEGYLPQGQNNDYPDWWPYRIIIIQEVQYSILNAEDLLDKTEDMISKNGYMPDLEVSTETWSWSDQEPGSTLNASFEVSNVGDDYSRLDWEITETPDWGTWTFDPEEGQNLQNNIESIIVNVEVTIPDEKNSDYSGQIKIVNKDDSSDYEIISISLSTPKYKTKTLCQSILESFEGYPIIYSILQLLLHF